MLTRGNRASGQKTQEEITLLKPTKSAIMKKENHDWMTNLTDECLEFYRYRKSHSSKHIEVKWTILCNYTLKKSPYYNTGAEKS